MQIGIWKRKAYSYVLCVLGRDCIAVPWFNITVLEPAAINLKAELMSQYCSLQQWLTVDDGWCQFTELCVPFSVNGCWFIAYVLCASISRLLFINTEFQTLRLKAKDSSGREHILTIKLKSKVRHTYRNTHSLLWGLDNFHTEYYSSSNGILYSLMLTYSQSKSKQANFTKRILDAQIADSKSVIYICAPKSRSNWRGCGETW